METFFEKLGGTYHQEGDYLLPNIETPESPQIGIWGQRRLQYLRTHKRVLYTKDDYHEMRGQKVKKIRDIVCEKIMLFGSDGKA